MSKSPNIPISKMNYEQLRDTVQLLSDELALFKRKYEDSINNIDYSNMSSVLIKEKDSMKSQITVTAEEIKTKVSEEDLSKQLLKYSTISQTSDKIELAVTEVKNYSDNGDYALSSQLIITNNKISSIVPKAISASFHSDYDPNSSYFVSDEQQKSMLCEYNGTFYYYDDYSGKWIIYPADGLKTMFEQTGTGFSLTGNVSINGGLIVDNTITASAIDTANLSCERLYAKGYKTGYYTKMASSIGDIGVYSPTAPSSANPKNNTCVWGVYNSDPSTQAVNFYAYGNNYLGHNGAQGKTYPKGIWDFSSADSVQGLSVVAVFG